MSEEPEVQNAENAAEVSSNQNLEVVAPGNEEAINQAVTFINNTVRETLYEGAIKIGNYLLENFFDNDSVQASSRNPHKPASFEELCKRPDLKIDATTLSRMIRVAAQERYFLEGDLNLDGLGYTHRISLLRVESKDKKIELASKCIAEAMSTRDFDQLIGDELDSAGETSTSEIPKNPVKFVSQIEKYLINSKRIALLKDPSQLKKLHQSSRDQLKAKAQELVRHLTEIAQDCNDLIRAIESPAAAETEKKTTVRTKKK